jgi:hypothetical protein
MSSETEKPDPARGWLFVEKLLANEETDEVDAMDDEGLAVALRARGRDPDKLTSVDDLMARAAAIVEREAARPRAIVVPLRPRRVRWQSWLAVASLGVLGVFVVKMGQGPDRVGAAPPDPHGLRVEGVRACIDRKWDLCEQRLDAARALDPAGDSDPTIEEARREIAEARKVMQEREEKLHEQPP